MMCRFACAVPPEENQFVGFSLTHHTGRLYIGFDETSSLSTGKV